MALALGKQHEWVKKLASSNRVVPLIEQAIDKLGDFDFSVSFSEKPGDDAWHPSGDCTPTLHELWEKATGRATYRPIGVGLRKIFTVGHFWHGYLQEVLVRSELVEVNQIEQRGMMGWGPVVPRSFDHIGDIPWAPWHWATGSIDVANFYVPALLQNAVVDFKTMKPTDFAKNDPPSWTAHKWECQVNVYMDWTFTDDAFIIGVDKSSGEMKEFHYERNQDLIDAIYLKWQIAAECVAEGIEPPEDEDVHLPLKGTK